MRNAIARLTIKAEGRSKSKGHGRLAVGADNVVTAVDLVLSCWTMEPKFGIRLQERPAIRHCQYLCHYDSLT